MVVTGLESATTPAHEPYVYWHECHTAIECYLSFLTESWTFVPMGGLLGLDLVQCMAVIPLYSKRRSKQLALLAEIKAFAQGVKQYHDEQAEKAKTNG
jgi:hypothetical protein